MEYGTNGRADLLLSRAKGFGKLDSAMSKSEYSTSEKVAGNDCCLVLVLVLFLEESEGTSEGSSFLRSVGGLM